ncbi:MAG: WXG100 family type VII secretion target [Mogibacterium sp.]|nr:WXG100 family type VII secretion target [Mogibacterium sp.]
MDINIKVTPEVLKAQSNQVMDDLRKIERSWQEIGRLIDGSRGYWQGEASDAHVSIYNELKGDGDRIVQRLKENPIKLQQMAGIYDATEQEAKGLSNQLPSDAF